MRVLIRPSEAELGVWGLTASLLGSFCTWLGAPKEGGARVGERLTVLGSPLRRHMSL